MSNTLQGCLVDIISFSQAPHAVDAAREAAAAVHAEWRGASTALAMLGEGHPFKGSPRVLQQRLHCQAMPVP